MARMHIVVGGDTLSTLAQLFYGDAGLFRVIAAANGIAEPYDVNVGQVLTIPDVTRTHTVVQDDTLSALAQLFYGDASLFMMIAAANGIAEPYDVNVGQVLTIPDVALVPPPAATPPIVSDPRGILPYASEPFGVYQPLIGWRSSLHQERLAQGLAFRFARAVDLSRGVTETTVERPVPKFESPRVLDPTGTSIGQALAVRARSGIADADAWQALLADTADSALTTITRQVLAATQGPADDARHAAHSFATVRQQDENEAQLRREAATAGLLQHLGATNPQAVMQLFEPGLQSWERALASVQFFAEDHPARQNFLSPIGILHRFREYFFELGTFLGPPVGHVWLSPGGTVEVIEVNTRRTTVDRTVEQATQTIGKSELDQTDRDELSDAVKVENANDTKLGATVTASGGVGKVYQASGSASFNLDNSRKQAQEQTHKRMREQSSKLSSEVQQNYKTTFRTVTETTDTSSRRYVLQNNTERLVSYELSRKMRKVAVQVQDLGQQLCWQIYVDNPGNALDAGEFVHETAAALDPGKLPEHIPYPADKPVTYPLAVPFNKFQGADDEAEHTYGPDPDNQDEGQFKPDVGSANNIQFRFKFHLPPAPEGMVLDHLSNIDFHGAQVEFTNPFTDPGLQPNPNIPDNSFQLRLTHANFGGQKQIPFDATFVYRAPQSVRDGIDAQNKALVSAYNDELAAKKEQSFYETLRKRLKLSSQVKARRSDDLREEERTIIYRAIVSALYGKEPGWTDYDYHVVSELIRYIFDIDSMLYFVAPDWWRPRVRPLTPMNEAGEIQATTLVQPGSPLRGGRSQHYLFTEETMPAPMGQSLGWFMELDGDANRNAFLNSPWVKAVLPIQPGREKEAIAFLKRTEVAGTDGLQEHYPFDPAQDPPEYQGLSLEEVLIRIADTIAKEQQAAVTPVPVDPAEVNSRLALPPETVFENGFDPLAGGIQFGSEPFKVFSQWTEILPTDQIVATEYSLKGLN